MRFEPTDDRILILPDPDTQEVAGIMLSENEATKSHTGTVVAVGDGVPLHNIKLNVTGEVSESSMKALKEVVELIQKGRPIKYKPGEKVMYGKFAGTKVVLDDVPHLIIRESDVFGRIFD